MKRLLVILLIGSLLLTVGCSSTTDISKDTNTSKSEEQIITKESSTSKVAEGENNQENKSDNKLQPIPPDMRESLMGLPDEAIKKMGYIPPVDHIICRIDFHGFKEFKEGNLDVYKNGQKLARIDSTPGGSYNKHILTPVNEGDTFKVEWSPGPDGQYLSTGFALSLWKLDKRSALNVSETIPEDEWFNDKLTEEIFDARVGSEVGPGKKNTYTYTVVNNKLIKN